MKHRFYEGIQMALSSVRVRSVFHQWLRAFGFGRIDFRSWKCAQQRCTRVAVLQRAVCGKARFCRAASRVLREGRCGTATSEKTLRQVCWSSCWGIPTRSRRTPRISRSKTRFRARACWNIPTANFLFSQRCDATTESGQYAEGGGQAGVRDGAVRT